MTEIKAVRTNTDFSRSHLPTGETDERRLDLRVNRRALMVYGANVLPHLPKAFTAKAGYNVSSPERFLDKQRERFVLASIVRQAHDGESGLDLSQAWVPKAQEGWERASAEVAGMDEFEDDILTDPELQQYTYDKVIHQRVDLSMGGMHFDDMPRADLVSRYLMGAIDMPGLDKSREVNVARMVGLINHYFEKPIQEVAA